MSKLNLTLACWDYDRTRALMDGSVRPDGIDLTYLNMPVEETFFRMLRYRELLKVEDIFRTTKSILYTRPIYHQTDEAIRGHVFCSFLALVLRKALEDRLPAAARQLRPDAGRHGRALRLFT